MDAVCRVVRMSDDTTVSLTGDEDGTESRTDDDLDETIYAEHHSIPDDTRETVLEGDGYRCQIKGCRGMAVNGSARLLVQRLVDNPTHCGRDDPENLETRCLRCCRWVERMPGRDDLQPILQDRLNGVDIETTWAEILQYLADNGPAPTGEITEAVSLSSTVGVRRALYALMGLDEREDVDGRLVVKDRVNQTYGLPWQVPDDQQARGVIPLQPATRQSRILDEFVRRLYEELPNDISDTSQLVAEIVNRDPDQAYQMRRRADAFQFPFDVWADTKRPRQGATAVIEAVDVLAGATDNVSRQLVSRVLADLFENNDEPDLASLLRDWASDGDPDDTQLGLADIETAMAPDQPCAASGDTNTRPPDQTGVLGSSGDESPEAHELHVFKDSEVPDSRSRRESAGNDRPERTDGVGGEADS